LDVVVTSDTALAHLAGAAGVETWVVLPFAADWRWGKERETSPWYPSVRLYRQPAPGDWSPVFREVAKAMGERIGAQVNPGMVDLVSEFIRDLMRKGREDRTKGRPDEAIAQLREAFQLRSRDPEVTHELALALAARKDRFETELCFRRCLKLRPNFAEVCNNLGILLEETGRAEEACAYFRRSLEHRSNSAETHSNLGVALAARGEYEQAIASYHESLRLKTDNPAALNNLGNALRNLGLPHQAIELLDRAITMQPGYAEAHNNKGIALVLLGRVKEALACYARALELKPDYAEAHLNRALSFLATGHYEEGWREYESRWQCNGLSQRSLPGRRWDGGEVTGGSLLLYVEQGLGDTIQFARLVPLVAKRAKAPVVLECQPPLVPLIRSFPGLDRVIPVGQPLPECAAHIPLMSLPGLLNLTDLELPATRIPYLHPEPSRVERWRLRATELTPDARLRVGIGWQGNPRFKADRNRSVPLAHFWPLAGIDGVRLISLQKGPGEEQLAEWGERLGVVRLGADVDRDGAFLDTLAVLASLDVVVTSDTALAHLAGAAGVETWVVLPFAADWRWGKERPTCAWYPTMRLFRQRAPGDWQGVFGRIGDELVARARAEPLERNDWLGEVVTALRRRGSTEVKADRLPAAVDLYKQALRLQPSNPDLLHNLGVAWAKQAALPVAQAYFKEAVRLKPDAAETHNNLGLSYLQQNRLYEAEACFRSALRSCPDHPDALNHMGVVFANQERWADAAEWYRAAVRSRPQSAEALNNLGNALRWLNQPEEAVEHLRAATQHRPDSADMWNNLGIALGQVGKIREALDCFRKALDLEPEHADALNNMGVSEADLGREAEGVACLERAIQIKQDFPEAHKNLGLTRLMRGDLRGGWAEYEWRWRCKGNTPRSYAAPLWDGKSIAGAGALLLYAEQGLGDTIQFIRFAAAASERANAPVIFECQPSLHPLLRSFPGVKQVVPAGATLPAFSAHAPLLSVPHMLGVTESDLPGIGIPYLSPDAERSALWKSRLAEQFPDDWLRIGVGWQGNPKYAGDRHRSVPVVFFTALHRVPRIHLVSLQKDPGTEQLVRLPPWFPILPLDPQADGDGAFLDTLAILSALDLVVTSDTALAHLAGAAGLETWVVLPFAADWRWGRGRRDCAWYPRMRLFRQPAQGDWASVFQEVAREIEVRTGASRAVTAAISHGELFDKITILEIKVERIQDEEKRANVARELAALQMSRPTVPTSVEGELARLLERLKEINCRLWQVEDDLRDCERAGCFDDRFIGLARSVYHLNDERAAGKKAVNELFQSPIIEEKSYAPYTCVEGGP
jgi:tetratricopeptide (TPR) repeat protein